MPKVNYTEVVHAGLDDWSIKKRHIYASVLVDLDRHKIVDILPSRDEKKVAAWLKKFSNLEVVSRDGAKFFSHAITMANPNIIQVSDRFHYLKTACGHAFRAIMRALPTHIAVLDTAPVRTVRTPRTEFQTKKLQVIREVRDLFQKGWSMTEISNLYGTQRRTVKRYLNNDPDFSRKRPFNSLVPFTAKLKKLTAQNQSHREIYNALVKAGYSRTYRTFMEYRKQTLKLNIGHYSSISRHQVASLLFRRKSVCPLTIPMRAVIIKYPKVKRIFNLFFELVELCEGKRSLSLDKWLTMTSSLNDRSMNAACVSIQRDQEAIRNSIDYQQYSNGPIEGKNNKIKCVKKIMFGRSSFKTIRNKLFLLENY